MHRCLVWVGRKLRPTQEKLQAALVDQLAGAAFSYLRLVTATAPVLWLALDRAAVDGQLSLHKASATLVRFVSWWLTVLPCIANLLLRLSYKLRARCGRFSLEILFSLGFVALAAFLASAFLVFEEYVVWQLLPNELLASLSFLGLTGAVNFCLWRLWVSAEPVSLFLPSRQFLILILYWNFLRQRYQAPRSHPAHLKAWQQLGAKAAPLLQAFRLHPFVFADAGMSANAGMAMSVRKMSGEEVVSLDAAELAALAAGFGDSVLGLKRYLHQRLGVPRFRQQLTAHDEPQPLSDEQKLTSFKTKAELLVVILPWSAASPEENEQLRAACLEGAAEELEALLQRPLDPDFLVDRTGRAPLWIACARGHVDNARLLLDAAANVNRTDRKGMSPLWIASYWGHSSVVQLLLEATCEVDKADNRGDSSPLFVASRNCCEGVVKLLVQAAADLNRCNIDRQSPVWIASGAGHPPVLRLLLQAQADLSASDRGGRSPLWIAMANSHMEPQLMDVLKAEPDSTESIRTTVVRMLLEARARIDSDDAGESVLSVGARLGNAHIMQLLVDASAPGGDAGASCFSQPAWKASAEGHDDIVQMLLKAGADKNWANSSGETLLWSAVKKGYTRVAQVLLHAGCCTWLREHREAAS
ncbi:mask-1 [Symbiodinium natans]|uniref:Mask-1 protein n=1 Tax=Symbiodinium natans TaxID=878477 RepID=A0A812M6F1_9DINO|nr:mask-1 [Symbiodinium natans]